jgi:hypothetical protein
MRQALEIPSCHISKFPIDMLSDELDRICKASRREPVPVSGELSAFGVAYYVFNLVTAQAEERLLQQDDGERWEWLTGLALTSVNYRERH